MPGSLLYSVLVTEMFNNYLRNAEGDDKCNEILVLLQPSL